MKIPIWGDIVLDVTFDVSQLLSRIEAIYARLQQMDAIREQMADILRQDAAEQFASGGMPAWKPLAASTIAARVANSIASQSPLVVTGALRDSWTKKEHPAHVLSVDPDGMGISIGSSLPYAAFHQLGSRAHVIRAVRAKALRFIAADGTVVFRKSVKHPGTVKRAITKTPNAQAKITEAVRKWINEAMTGEPSG